MKVLATNKEKHKFFSELKYGEAFWWNSSLYMKVNTNGFFMGGDSAVRLKDGAFVRVMHETAVTTPADVVVEERLFSWNYASPHPS